MDFRAVVVALMDIAKAINNVALMMDLHRKQVEKLDRTISKLNDAPTGVTVEEVKL